MTPLEVLNRVFGYDAFRGQQEPVIDHVTDGRDALVVMPTGGGKSVCYQIPAMVMPGTAVVVSPLIALMQDQVDALRAAGVNAAYLNSTLDPDARNEVRRALRNHELEMIYMAPEGLMNERTLEMLDDIRLNLIAIDEAHCVVQWGHDFRPDYMHLSRLAERFPDVPRIALTATADEAARREISCGHMDEAGSREGGLGMDNAREFLASFDRPNIRYRVGLKKSPKEQLKRFIQANHPGDAGIVYCMSRKRVDDTAAWLCQQGINAMAYHAGMDSGRREQVQSRFIHEEGIVMVATIAFGMGIDKPNVRFVAHLDLPKSIEAYYQETGRAGRDDLAADAWMVYGLQDVVTVRRMVQDSELSEERKRHEQQRLNALLGFCETPICRRRVLLRYFNEELDEDCGNCDICIDGVETFDGTEAARKALSCVYRTGQRFGVAHLVDVLLGKQTERIDKLGHARLSVYGIGTEIDAGGWRSIFRQLVSSGFLTVDFDGYGSLRLTEESRPVLRGEQPVVFRKDPVVSAGRSASSSTRTSSAQSRDRKSAPVAADGVIFHDRTLQEMSAVMPENETAMLSVSGVGEKKLERYGEPFLDLIRTLKAGESSSAGRGPDDRGPDEHAMDEYGSD